MVTEAIVLDSRPSFFAVVKTHAPGPGGSRPFTVEMLLNGPLGICLGLSQNARMGWEPSCLLDPEFVVLSAHGGMCA
jgi:hypothetical protein